MKTIQHYNNTSAELVDERCYSGMSVSVIKPHVIENIVSNKYPRS